MWHRKYRKRSHRSRRPDDWYREYTRRHLQSEQPNWHSTREHQYKQPGFFTRILRRVGGMLAWVFEMIFGIISEILKWVFKLVCFVFFITIVASIVLMVTDFDLFKEIIGIGNEQTTSVQTRTDTVWPYHASGCSITQLVWVYPETEEASQQVMEYINKLREQNGKQQISWDRRAYQLAMARARDMRENDYLDHTNPKTGTCPYNMKRKYGFAEDEDVAENAFGSPEPIPTKCVRLLDGTMQEPINDWMTSRGHRYNLMYDDHIAGAVGCYKNMCTFLGVNRVGFAKECQYGAPNMEFWKHLPKQPGEV